MNNLLKKYLSGEKINIEELDKLRNIPETDVADALREDWDDYFSVHTSTEKFQKWKWVLLGVAAVMLPVLLISTILLWNRTNSLSSQDIVIKTAANGERATITLPDGSEVTLNSNSCLSYKPEDFTGDTRSVTFEGEGFFTISKSDSKKFLVHTSLVSVDVKGTTFNLRSCKKDHTASLYLESGKVELKSVASGKCIEMIPGDFAYLDEDGIGFIKDENIDPRVPTAWKIGELIFINQNLGEVTGSLEYNYNTNIEFSDPQLVDIPFTGTLPNNNLPDAVHILELSMGLKCTKKGNTLLFYK